MSTKLISRLIQLGLWRRKSRFLSSLRSPQIMQDRVLKRINTKLAQTEYGRLFNVQPEDDYQTFTKKIPIVTYDHIRHLIERQKDFDRPVLTAEPILSFEQTSGFFGKSKTIPYTRELKQSFHNAYALTLADLLGLNLNLRTGKTFMMLLHNSAENEYARLPQITGAPENYDQLDGFFGRMLKRYMVVPQKVNSLYDREDFHHVAALYLLAEPNLEVISILNPSLLELLMQYMQNEADILVPQLLRGRITKDNITFEFKPIDKERADLLSRPPYDWSKVWPNLQVISCFTSGRAKLSLSTIKAAFENVKIHSKGLLTTEAPITVRLAETAGYVPCLQDVFFEFLDDEGKIHRLSSVSEGREYDVIVSQLSGLYRYKIGDRVRVTHFYKNTPCLEFVGRTNIVSDIAGEKLNEAFARKCIDEVIEDFNAFALLVPYATKGSAPHYYLVTNQTSSKDDLSRRLDEALSGAFHYRSARLNGRLQEIKVRSHPYAKELFIRYYSDKGVALERANTCALIQDIAQAQEYFGLILKQS